MASLDLPQVYEKPAYETLLAALEGLCLQPPAWNCQRRSAVVEEGGESLAAVRKADITRYISTIVSSSLGWIGDEEKREKLWDLAARRMSERCGRAAMGDIVRRWPFEATDGVGAYEPFELVIREPALTGDSLGFKTWGASYLLARHLSRLGATSLFRLFDESLGQEPPDVLELGSGTGLLGLAAAVLWKVRVCLSDLPGITGNLKSNVDGNRAVVEARGSAVDVGMLTWGAGGEDEVDQELFGEENQFKIVLAADPMYDDNHPVLLASAIGQHLALGTESRAVVMVPQRDSVTARLLEGFKQAMLDLDLPLFCVEEDELAGQDDWVGDDEEGHVRCWLGVFSRGGSPMSV